jgi:hypothetical protein
MSSCLPIVGGSLRVLRLLSSTTKTGRHDIAEILLKVTLSTKNQSILQGLLKNKDSILELAYPSRAPVFTTVFGGIRVVHLFLFSVFFMGIIFS